MKNISNKKNRRNFSFHSTNIYKSFLGKTIKLWFIRGSLLLEGSFLRTKQKKLGLQSFFKKGLLLKYHYSGQSLTFFLINYLYFEKVLYRIGISKYHAISIKKQNKNFLFPLMRK